VRVKLGAFVICKKSIESVVKKKHRGGEYKEITECFEKKPRASVKLKSSLIEAGSRKNSKVTCYVRGLRSCSKAAAKMIGLLIKGGPVLTEEGTCRRKKKKHKSVLWGRAAAVVAFGDGLRLGGWGPVSKENGLC